MGACVLGRGPTSHGLSSGPGRLTKAHGRREGGHGLEQEAHSPRTMGEAAKGPAGVAGFLKEKSQNELLRARLAPDSPVPPVRTSTSNRNPFQGQCVCEGEDGEKHKVARPPPPAPPWRMSPHSLACRPSQLGLSLALGKGRGGRRERGQQGFGSNAGTPNGETPRSGDLSDPPNPDRG